MPQSAHQHPQSATPVVVVTFLIALAIWLPLLLPNEDFAALLVFVVAIPLSVIWLIFCSVRGKGRRRSQWLSSLTAILIISTICYANFRTARNISRWTLFSRSWKRNITTQPLSANGGLRHAEWEGWGFPGAGDTVVYLVYDPTDLLPPDLSTHSRGSFKALPCEVVKVSRLEPHWYSVLFYTQTTWDECGGAPKQS